MMPSVFRRYRNDLTAGGFMLIALILAIALYFEAVGVAVALFVIAMFYLVDYNRIRGTKHHPGYYLVFVWSDVEPSLEGPFTTPDERVSRAREFRRENGDEHGIYWLDISESREHTIGAFAGIVLSDDDEGDSGGSSSHLFLNHYRCPQCNHQWGDSWSATCDTDCPECGHRHISPHKSEDYPGESRRPASS
ncbi:MAG: hypothetical protein ACYC9J_11650 [Sulfuricaulis sp.]